MIRVDSLYGESFYQQLQELSTEAFKSSVVSNNRRKLGRIVYGNAEAMWRTKLGGTAVLRESGVRIGAMPLGNWLPTELWLAEPAEPYGTSATELTTYKMDLLSVGSVEIATTTINERHMLRQIVKQRIAAFINVQDDPQNPTIEQKIVLLEELTRGASGEHALLPSM